MNWGSARVADNVGSCPDSQRKGLGCRGLATAVLEPTWLFFLQLGASPRRIAVKSKCGWIKEAMPFAGTFVGLQWGVVAARCLICRECCGSGYTRPGHGCETSVVRELEPRTILQHGPSDQSWPARFAGNPQPPDTSSAGTWLC
jgi:hypothetical protein